MLNMLKMDVQRLLYFLGRLFDACFSTFVLAILAAINQVSFFLGHCFSWHVP